MVEIYSQADLYADAHRGAKLIEDRRQKLRGSLWLAMAFSEQATVTGCLRHECRDTIGRLVPRNGPTSMWTARMVYILQPALFPMWKPMTTDADVDEPKGKAGNNSRDRLIVKLCKENGMTLVTRDRKGKRGQPSIYKLAENEGVKVLLPEAYAATVLPRERARDMFLERLQRGATAYSEAESGNERVERIMAMLETLERHHAIWEPDGYALNGGRI